jgi:hypothetical protein
MPDKKLTDSEIIKALKCCIKCNSDCEKCEIYDFCEEHNKEMNMATLDLINRLQAENEKLQKFKAYFDFYYGCDLEILGVDENGNTTSFDEFYNCAIADAESIEHHIAHIIKTAKAEAHKECVEKVKREIDRQPHSKSLEASGERFRIKQILDNLLKELVGDNNV